MGDIRQNQKQNLEMQRKRRKQRFFGVVTLAKPFGRPESKTLNLETTARRSGNQNPHRRGRRGRRGRREKRRQGVVFPSQNRRKLRRLSGLALQRQRRKQRFFGVVTLAQPFGRPESKTLNLETQRDAAATKTPHRRGRRGRRKTKAGDMVRCENRRKAAKTFRIGTADEGKLRPLPLKHAWFPIGFIFSGF